MARRRKEVERLPEYKLVPIDEIIEEVKKGVRARSEMPPQDPLAEALKDLIYGNLILHSQKTMKELMKETSTPAPGIPPPDYLKGIIDLLKEAPEEVKPLILSMLKSSAQPQASIDPTTLILLMMFMQNQRQNQSQNNQQSDLTTQLILKLIESSTTQNIELLKTILEASKGSKSEHEVFDKIMAYIDKVYGGKEELYKLIIESMAKGGSDLDRAKELLEFLQSLGAVQKPELSLKAKELELQHQREMTKLQSELELKKMELEEKEKHREALAKLFEGISEVAKSMRSGSSISVGESKTEEVEPEMVELKFSDGGSVKIPNKDGYVFEYKGRKLRFNKKSKTVEEVE